jgi:hypothetical protein
LASLRCAVPGTRNDDDISDLLLCSVLPLHALHNQTAIDGSFKTVMPDGLIGGALIPCLGRFEAREFRDHDAVDGVALQNLKTAVVDEDIDLVACECCPDLIPINFQLCAIRIALPGVTSPPI